MQKIKKARQNPYSHDAGLGGVYHDCLIDDR